MFQFKISAKLILSHRNIFVMYISQSCQEKCNFGDGVLFSIHVSAMAGAHIKQTVDNITKSAEDKRLYRGLELDNGMKVNRTPKQDTQTGHPNRTPTPSL